MSDEIKKDGEDKVVELHDKCSECSEHGCEKHEDDVVEASIVNITKYSVRHPNFNDIEIELDDDSSSVEVSGNDQKVIIPYALLDQVIYVLDHLIAEED